MGHEAQKTPAESWFGLTLHEGQKGPMIAPILYMMRLRVGLSRPHYRAPSSSSSCGVNLRVSFMAGRDEAN
jgi:hypothetical protein